MFNEQGLYLKKMHIKNKEKMNGGCSCYYNWAVIEIVCYRNFPQYLCLALLVQHWTEVNLGISVSVSSFKRIFQDVPASYF